MRINFMLNILLNWLYFIFNYSRFNISQYTFIFVRNTRIDILNYIVFRISQMFLTYFISIHFSSIFMVQTLFDVTIGITAYKLRLVSNFKLNVLNCFIIVICFRNE